MLRFHALFYFQCLRYRVLLIILSVMKQMNAYPWVMKRDKSGQMTITDGSGSLICTMNPRLGEKNMTKLASLISALPAMNKLIDAVLEYDSDGRVCSVSGYSDGYVVGVAEHIQMKICGKMTAHPFCLAHCHHIKNAKYAAMRPYDSRLEKSIRMYISETACMQFPYDSSCEQSTLQHFLMNPITRTDYIVKHVKPENIIRENCPYYMEFCMHLMNEQENEDDTL